jgi:hypothetical protein
VCKVTEPVEIHWKERETASGTGDVLLGAIPLEDMDLMMNPAKRELIGAHGDKVVYLVKYPLRLFGVLIGLGNSPQEANVATGCYVKFLGQMAFK